MSPAGEICGTATAIIICGAEQIFDNIFLDPPDQTCVRVLHSCVYPETQVCKGFSIFSKLWVFPAVCRSLSTSVTALAPGLSAGSCFWVSNYTEERIHPGLRTWHIRDVTNSMTGARQIHSALGTNLAESDETHTQAARCQYVISTERSNQNLAFTVSQNPGSEELHGRCSSVCMCPLAFKFRV